MLIIGIPNAGKTTYSAQYPNTVCYDNLRHLSREERIPIYAKADVIEGIYNTVASRRRVLSAWEGREGRRVCIWLDTPVDECCRRENRHRPIGIVHAHARNFEPPTLDEGWDEIQIIKGGNLHCLKQHQA